MFRSMTKLDTPKKPVPGDWHPADIKAALEKRGYSLARLSRVHKYCRSSAAVALHMPWPKMERLIAEAIGTTPQQIWPSRYHADGTPRSGRGERGIGRRKSKDSIAPKTGNVSLRRAA